MKILHTADWHIGKRFNSVDYLEDFIFFKEELLNVVREKAIDVLLVSGDVFDVYSPSTNAQECYYDTLNELSEIDGLKHIIVTAGNHDSASWLQAPKAFLKKSNIEVVGAARHPQDAWISLHCNDETVHVAAVPFLRQSDFPELPADATYASVKEKNARGLIEYYQEVHKHQPSEGVKIAMGHFTCINDYNIDSEREISIGNIDGTSKTDLPVFDYFALGHIHKPMTVSASNHIFYSGSPYPMSFSERQDEKRVLIFDTASKEVESVKVATYRKFVQIAAQSEAEIEQELKEIIAPDKKHNEFLQMELKLASDTDVVSNHKKLMDLRTLYNDEFIENKRPFFIEKVGVASQAELSDKTIHERPEISGELISPEDLVNRIIENNEERYGVRKESIKNAFQIILENLDKNH